MHSFMVAFTYCYCAFFTFIWWFVLGGNMSDLDYCTLAIARTAQKIETYFNKQLGDIGVTLSQLSILMFVIECEESGRRIFQRDIEHEFSLSNPAVTGILQRLEAKKLIKRSISETDSRCKWVLLTESGKSLKNACTAKRTECIKKFAENIPPEDIDAAIRVINAMCENISRESSGDSQGTDENRPLYSVSENIHTE